MFELFVAQITEQSSLIAAIESQMKPMFEKEGQEVRQQARLTITADVRDHPVQPENLSSHMVC